MIRQAARSLRSARPGFAMTTLTDACFVIAPCPACRATVLTIGPHRDTVRA